MAPVDGYEKLKVKELKAKLQEKGKPVTGNKSTLIQRLREDSESTASDDQREANLPSVVSKAIYDDGHIKNPVYDWSSALLTGSDDDDIPVDVKAIANNHDDLSFIRELLWLISQLNLEASTPPSPTETMEKFKMALQVKLPSPRITSHATASLLRDLGVHTGELQADLSESDVMTGVVRAVAHAIRTWLLDLIQNHDWTGTKYPENFSFDDRRSLRAWGKKWIQAHETDCENFSKDDVKVAAGDETIPVQRARNTTTIGMLLRTICAELRRDKKAKNQRKAKRKAADMDEEEDEEESTIVTNSRRSRTRRVISDEEDES